MQNDLCHYDQVRFFFSSASSFIGHTWCSVPSSSITFPSSDATEDSKNKRKRKTFSSYFVFQCRIFFDKNRTNNTCYD